MIEIESIDDWNTFIKSMWNNKTNNTNIFIVDFYATYCGPCRTVKPKYIELSEKYFDIPFLSVDIEKVTRLAEEFDVTSLPTFMIFKNYKVIKTIVGADIASLISGIENA
jgi:thioredoxin 1